MLIEKIPTFVSFRRFTSCFAPKPPLVFGSKKSKAARETRRIERIAAVRERKTLETRGLLLDTKKELRMELKRNSRIGWYRSLQVCKHIEMHARGRGPPIDDSMRAFITTAAEIVKSGK